MLSLKTVLLRSDGATQHTPTLFPHVGFFSIVLVFSGKPVAQVTFLSAFGAPAQFCAHAAARAELVLAGEVSDAFAQEAWLCWLWLHVSIQERSFSGLPAGVPGSLPFTGVDVFASDKGDPVALAKFAGLSFQSSPSPPYTRVCSFAEAARATFTDNFGLSVVMARTSP